MIYLKRIKILLGSAHTEALEFSLALAVFGLGVWVSLPFSSFSTKSFNFFLSVAPEPFWGLVLIILGFLSVLAILSDRTRLRKFSMALIAMSFFTIATGFVLSGFFTTGVFMYSYLYVLSLFVYFRIGWKRGY